MRNIILNFIAYFFIPQLPSPLRTPNNVWYNWYHSKWEQRVWRVHKKGDNKDNGARCSKCRLWIERKDKDSLQIHELIHWE